MRLRTSRQDSVPYEDDIPFLPHLAVCAHEDPTSEDSEPVSSFAFQTKPDQYGVYRVYSSGNPTITPDSGSPYLALNTSTQSPISTPPLSPRKSDNDEEDPWFAPFLNPSTYRLMDWFNNSSATKSMTELQSLVHNVLQAPDFKVEELAGFRVAKENARLDNFKFKKEKAAYPGVENGIFDDSWIKGTVHIPLPCDGVRQPEDGAPLYPVTFYYRNILSVIKAALSELKSKGLHTFPFKAYWHPSKGEPPERIYSESYTANRWNDEYDKINNSREDGPNRNLEAFLIALMIWSDSTVLAQFGTASLWPIYLYIGNLSKYTRGKPTSMSARHLAYLPKVSASVLYVFLYFVLILPQLGDDFQEFYFKTFGKYATAAMLTHIRREIAQAVWMVILDDEFMEAYVHGFLEELNDWVTRLGFPRFLTYSADYPEK